MHLRRIAAFLLGAWIAGSLFMAYIAHENSRGAAAVLGRAPAAVSKTVQSVGPAQAALLMAFQAAEQNRRLTRVWGAAQAAIGLALMALLAIGPRVNRLAVGLCGVMLVMAVFSHFVLAPEINFLVRGLSPASGWTENRARYLALNGTYLLMEGIKLALGCVLAGSVFTYKPRRRNAAGRETLEESEEIRL